MLNFRGVARSWLLRRYAQPGLNHHVARLLAGWALWLGLLPPLAYGRQESLLGLLLVPVTLFVFLMVAAPLLGALQPVLILMGGLPAGVILVAGMAMLNLAAYAAGTRYLRSVT